MKSKLTNEANKPFQKSSQTVAIVTGGSSGIGRATAMALVSMGCRVYEFSRRRASVPGVNHLTCDVSHEDLFRRCIQTVLEAEGHIDILINNAGFGISGAAEFTDNADAKRLMEVNLFGVVNGCRAVLPVMRAQGYGRILNISSVAASISIPFQAWYSVSKAAVSSYTAAIRNEIYPFGIQITSILPGDICTGFTAAREKSPVGDDVYGGRISRSVSTMEYDEEHGMNPIWVGHKIAAIALKRRLKPEYTIGFAYRLAVLLCRLLPSEWKSRLIRQIYAR